MSSLSDAKVLGGIGSILVLFAVVPTIGWLIGIAGFVMILVAISKISQVVNDKKIFENTQIAVVLAIGAVAVAAITIAGAVYGVFGVGPFMGPRFGMTTNVTSLPFAPFGPFDPLTGLGLAIIGGLLAAWAILVASAVFLRRSYASVASKLNISMFGTAGLLFLVGAATAIIGIGFVLMFVAEILLVVSFFSIPDEHRATQAMQTNTVIFNKLRGI